MVILGLLAGATADIFDRRRLLIFWQAWMLTAVAILSVLTFFDIISPWILLILTFLLNIGTAMNSPAWQAIVPEVIPRAQLPDAVSLNSPGLTSPAPWDRPLGGLAIALFAHATTGAASVFLLNSLSFVGVILVLYRWQRNPLFKSALPAERIRGSVRAGIRYLRYAPMLQAAFMRTHHLHPLCERRLGPAGHRGPQRSAPGRDGIRHPEWQHGLRGGDRRNQSAAGPQGPLRGR